MAFKQAACNQSHGCSGQLFIGQNIINLELSKVMDFSKGYNHRHGDASLVSNGKGYSYHMTLQLTEL